MGSVGTGPAAVTLSRALLTVAIVACELAVVVACGVSLIAGAWWALTLIARKWGTDDVPLGKLPTPTPITKEDAETRRHLAVRRRLDEDARRRAAAIRASEERRRRTE